MATPLYDEIDLRVSRALDDPVNYTAGGGAATAGKIYSVAARQDFINRANIDLQSFIWNKFLAELGDTEAARNVVRRILQSVVKSVSTGTFASAGITILGVATDFNNMAIALSKTGSTASFVFKANKLDLDNNVDRNVTNAWTIESGKLYAYQSGAVLTAGTGTLYYLAADQVTQNSSTDILLSRQFWDVLRDLACYYALSERPTATLAPPQMYRDRAIAFIATLK